jgi:nucleoside-diphosphate-sugar epimerase
MLIQETTTVTGMKILLTGGAGYLGSTLASLLLDKGHEVTIFDIFMWGISPVLPIADNINLEIIKGDIIYKELLANVMT